MDNWLDKLSHLTGERVEKDYSGILSDKNNLEICNPELAKEWHPNKNGSLTAKSVAPSSDKKVWWKCDKNHEWEVRVANRTNGKGCPYCSNRYVCDDNCLETIYPELAKEWHPTKNVNLTAKDVTPSSGKKVWWKCDKNHEWEATVNDRTKGRGCPYCSNKKVCGDNCLETINPELAREWHPNKNGSLTAKSVAPKSHKKVWWKCDKNHEWEAVVYSRTKGYGCPYCSNRYACDNNCLETINPELAKQWHPNKNGSLTTKDVTPSSRKKVWWKCDKNHEWESVVRSRTNGHGCRKCYLERIKNG